MSDKQPTPPPGPEQQPADNELSPLSIIGIGASAGGLSALQGFFGSLPDNTGMTFVIVIHLSPEHESNLAELLQAYTTMSVIQVTGLTAMKPNNVYVIPPAKQIVVKNENLDLEDFEQSRHRPLQIDTFFRSLAATHSDGAAVILSGSGSDGAVGIQAIKEKGGLLLAQAPDEAEHDSMPRSAIATGLIDIVAPVAELASHLVAAKRMGKVLQLPTADEALSEASQHTLYQILAHLRVRTGHDFAGYKQATLLRRIVRRMQLTQLITLAAYLNRLRQDEAEANLLFRDLLINVTEFYRDPEAWNVLEKTIIPQLFVGKGRDDAVRIWSVGCATGEEAYSVAMLLMDYANELLAPPLIQIFASDLSKTALDFAREGVYPEAIAEDITEQRLARYFLRDNSHYRVRSDLREAILFTQHNLLQDPPFSKLDLILCRNLLIYIQRDLQEKIFETFYYALRPGGVLFLGNAESADTVTTLFDILDKRQRLYQRQPQGGGKSVLPSIPMVSHPIRSPSFGLEKPESSQIPDEEHRQLLAMTLLPSVLVDSQYMILHLSETVGRYLLPPGGVPTTDLIKLVRPELQPDLRTTLLRTFEEGRSLSTRPVPVRFNGAAHLVYIMVYPHQLADGKQRALVIFLEDETPIPTDRDRAEQADPQNMAQQRAETELQHTQGRLQSMREEYETTVEELRAANEELQSTNEEYKSTLEELETSKEELQSINEELQTINQELKNKVEEVTQAHSDLQNLFIATDLATLFLDRALHIKRYTPRAVDLFNLMPPDRGRPISHLRANLIYAELESDARRVLAHLVPVEREIQNKEGQWYLVRVRPYRTLEDKIDGVVMSFVEITERKRRELNVSFLANLGEVLDHAMSPTAILHSLDEKITQHFGGAQLRFAEFDANTNQLTTLYVTPTAGTNGWPRLTPDVLRELKAGNLVAVNSQNGHANGNGMATVATSDSLRGDLFAPYTTNGELRYILALQTREPYTWRTDEIELVRELTNWLSIRIEYARAVVALNENVTRQRTIFETMAEGVITIDRDGRFFSANAAAEQILGIERAALIGTSIDTPPFRRLALDGTPWQNEPTLAEIEAAGDQVFHHDYLIERKDGSRVVISRNITALHNTEGQLMGFVSTFSDITERYQAELTLRASEERQTYLLRLGDALRPLGRVDEVIRVATQVLGEQLGVNRAYYAEVEENNQYLVILPDYYTTDEPINLAGRQPIQEAGVSVMRELQANRPVVVADTQTLGEESEADRAAYATIAVRAFIAYPIFKGERLAAILGVTQNTPRTWSDNDLALIAETAERTWASVRRIRAEMDLREREDSYRLLVESAKEYAIFMLDPTGHITTWNTGSERIFGYHAQEAIGQRSALIFTPEDRVAGVPQTEMEIAAKEGQALDERWHIRKNGTRFWASGALEALRYPDQAIRGFVKVLRDNTQQKLNEEMLEERVRQRTEQIRALASSLTMAEQEERRRVAQILHDDLQQQLYGIQMRLITVLTDVTGTALSSHIQEAYGWLDDAIRVTRHLTVDLSPPVLKDEGLADALNWLASQMAEMYNLKVAIHAEQRFQLAQEAMRILLFQVVRELLFNVVKHAGIKQATIDLAEQDANTIRITVSDQGNGFDVQQAEQDKEGGFGLFSVRERLALFGGRMEIDSAPGQGTRITLYTPLASPDPQVTPPDADLDVQ